MIHDMLLRLYDYDAFGNRIEKSTWLSESEYIFRTLSVQDRGQVPIEYVLVNYTDSQLGDGLYKESYFLWDPSRVDRLISSEYAAYTETYDFGSFEWALLDHQGTVLGHIERPGASGVPDFDEIKYDPFGRPEGEFDWEADPGDDPYPGLFNVTRYCGREFDYETGLQYNRARYYNPAGSRWMSEDPMGFGAGDANLYRYVGNSPTNATDPSGQIPLIPILAVAGIVWYNAHKAEARFNETNDIISQAPEDISQADIDRANELVGKASWNLATAEIGLAGLQAYAIGYGVGMATSASYALGYAGTALRVGTGTYFAVQGFQFGNQLRKDWSEMSPVEQYQAGGSIVASIYGGYKGFRGGYSVRNAAIAQHLGRQARLGMSGRFGQPLKSIANRNLTQTEWKTLQRHSRIDAKGGLPRTYREFQSFTRGRYTGSGHQAARGRGWAGYRRMHGINSTTSSPKSRGWSNVRQGLGQSGWAAPGQDVHHWLIPQNSWGRSIPNAIKNQKWNLMRMQSRSEHFRVHGWSFDGQPGYNLPTRLWRGTPTPTKLTIGGGVITVSVGYYYWSE